MSLKNDIALEDLMTFTCSKDRIRTLLGLDDKATVLPDGKPLKPMKITVSRNLIYLIILQLNADELKQIFEIK